MSDSQKIIVNADDFGWSEETVAATAECFSQGALTSATLMPNMPATQSAIAFARSNSQFSFGIHLTFAGETDQTGEAPCSDFRQIPSLVKDDGTFLQSGQSRKRALLQRVSVAEIKLEMRAQIAKIVDAGVRVSHVDSHGHMHKFAAYREALRDVLPQFGIQRVRTAQNVYVHKNYLSPTYYLGPYWGWAIGREFSTTRYLYLPSGADHANSWPEKLLSRNFGSGVLEIGLHPGYEEPWRNSERLTALEIPALAKRHQVQLVSWNDI